MSSTENWLSAQSSCIACALLEKDSAAKLISETTEDDYAGAPLTIFREISAMWRNGEEIDPVIIDSRTGGAYNEYLKMLLTETPAMKSLLPEYITALRESAKLSKAAALLQDAQNGETDLKALEALQAGLAEILADSGRSKGKTAAELAMEFYSSVQQTPEYVKTGIDPLDRKFRYRPANFNLIAARPGVGKTAFALQAALFQAKDKRVGYFSLEGTGEELTERIMAHMARISWTKISDRNLNAADYAALGTAMSEFSARNFKCYDAAGWTAEEIAARATADRLEIVYIDYIQLVAGRRNSDGRYDIVTDSSITLRTLANRGRMVIFALSQLNRQGAGRPSLQDLRESGQLEQDADTVAMIYDYPEDKTGKTKVFEMQKNRHGQIGAMKLVWDGPVQTFIAEKGSDIKPLPDSTETPFD